MNKCFRWWMIALLALLALGIAVVWWSVANDSWPNQRPYHRPITVARGHWHG